MKKYSIFLLLFSISMTFLSCETTETSVEPKDKEEKEIEPIPGAILQGSFKGSSGYNTSGVASVSRSEDGNRTLTFTDFSTSNGPDLKVYLAEDNAATNFVEISDEVKRGNNSYAIPSDVDLSKQKFVLIWCKAFSVNFGYTELVEPE